MSINPSEVFWNLLKIQKTALRGGNNSQFEGYKMIGIIEIISYKMKLTQERRFLMNILRMVNNGIKKIEEIIIAYAVIAITLILFFNVITREFFDYSWKAAEEASIFLVIAVTFMAVSYASRKGKHITMTIFLDLVPNKAKKIMAIVNSV